MLRAKNIIRGFSTFTHPPKVKYLISLYRSEELNIIAVFTTSREQVWSGSPQTWGEYERQGGYIIRVRGRTGYRHKIPERGYFCISTTDYHSF